MLDAMLLLLVSGVAQLTQMLDWNARNAARLWATSAGPTRSNFAAIVRGGEMFIPSMNGLFQPFMLPPNKFFQPKPAFLSWMVTQFSKHLIYDVGSGVGHVSRLLTEYGLSVVAIDNNGRQEREFAVESVDGTSCGYRKGSVVMLCRPCHGDFASDVIEQAIRCKAGAIVYVGLKENSNIDLAEYRKYFKMKMRNVGADNERVYVMGTEYLKRNM